MWYIVRIMNSSQERLSNDVCPVCGGYHVVADSIAHTKYGTDGNPAIMPGRTLVETLRFLSIADGDRLPPSDFPDVRRA